MKWEQIAQRQDNLHTKLSEIKKLPERLLHQKDFLSIDEQLFHEIACESISFESKMKLLKRLNKNKTIKKRQMFLEEFY